MTRQEALIQIGQVILRCHYGADELVVAGKRPTYNQIERAVAIAAQLIRSNDDEGREARLELDRRYSPALFRYPAIVD